MKKKINLLNMSKNDLKELKAGAVVGGCDCGCLYAGPKEGPDDDYWGGSSTEDNNAANNGGGGIGGPVCMEGGCLIIMD